MDAAGSDREPGTARPGGRLRRVSGGRKRTVFLRLSEDEEALLVPKAAALGVSVQRLLVESALAGGPASVVERRALFRVLQAAVRDAHGVAVNINQLARWANQEHRMPSGVAGAVERFDAAQAALVAAAEQIVARLGSADVDAAR